MSDHVNGHLACPPSRRGHAWRELACRVLPFAGELTIRDVAELRVCDRCGQVGRVSDQGVVIPTSDRVDLGKVHLADRRAPL